MSSFADRNRAGSGPLARRMPLARCKPTASRKQTARRKPRWAGLALAHVLYMASGSGAWALQILEAADHAELSAEISTSAVNRIALDGDRVSRVIQSPSALTVEHDPVRGDVYLHAGGIAPAVAEPVTLYLGSERGFTYRLTLTAVDRGSAQILIRNAVVAADEHGGSRTFGSNADGRVGELVALIRAVARREPLPGYVIVVESDVNGRNPSEERSPSGPVAIETWRGPRWTARVFAHGNVLAHGDTAIVDAAALAEAAGPIAVAAWVSEPGQAPEGGRLAVVVEASPGVER